MDETPHTTSGVEANREPIQDGTVAVGSRSNNPIFNPSSTGSVVKARTSRLAQKIRAVQGQTLRRRRSHRSSRKLSTQPKIKAPLSAYNFFFKDQRLIVQTLRAYQRKRNIETEDSNLSGRDLFVHMTRVISQRWAKIQPSELARYQLMAQRDHQRYHSEIREHQKAKWKKLGQVNKDVAHASGEELVMTGTMRNAQLSDHHAKDRTSDDRLSNAIAEHKPNTGRSLRESIVACGLLSHQQPTSFNPPVVQSSYQLQRLPSTVSDSGIVPSWRVGNIGMEDDQRRMLLSSSRLLPSNLERQNWIDPLQHPIEASVAPHSLFSNYSRYNQVPLTNQQEMDATNASILRRLRLVVAGHRPPESEGRSEGSSTWHSSPNPPQHHFR